MFHESISIYFGGFTLQMHVRVFKRVNVKIKMQSEYFILVQNRKSWKL